MSEVRDFCYFGRQRRADDRRQNSKFMSFPSAFIQRNPPSKSLPAPTSLYLRYLGFSPVKFPLFYPSMIFSPLRPSRVASLRTEILLSPRTPIIPRLSPFQFRLPLRPPSSVVRPPASPASNFLPFRRSRGPALRSSQRRRVKLSSCVTSFVPSVTSFVTPYRVE